MKTHSYIITADDYGMCPEVTSAIEALAEKGILSTTNVLVNFGTDFSSSPLRSYKNFSVGLHWNVTTGFPVSPKDTIPSLIDANGRFHSIDEFRRRFKRGLISTDELKLELEAQYELFYRSFGQADYWNTHENSSLHPSEYKCFEEVALKHNIPATRNFQRFYVDYHTISFKRKLREFLIKAIIDCWYGKHVKKVFNVPDARLITFNNISKTDITLLKKAVSKNRKNSVEIVIHPATTGEHPLFGNIGNDRLIEFEKYMSDEFYELFENSNSHIVSFDALVK